MVGTYKHGNTSEDSYLQYMLCGRILCGRLPLNKQHIQIIACDFRERLFLSFHTENVFTL